MATDIRNLPANVATDAQFREWAQGVDAALLACGLIAYPQTGEADLTTLLTPSAGQQSRGFRCYRFNDTLQATKPVYIRLDFASGSTATKPALWLMVGTLMNGSGGFLGIVQSQQWTGGGANVKGAGARLDQYASGAQGEAGGGRIFLVTVFDPADYTSTAFIVERLKNANGTYHASGAVFVGFLSGQASNQIACQMLAHGLSPSGVGARWPMIALSLAIHNPAVGSDLALAPLMVSRGVWLYGWPLTYRDSDMARLVPFTITHMGASHVYMPLGIFYGASGFTVPLGGGTTDALALLWE